MRKRKPLREEVRDCVACGRTTLHEVYESWERAGRLGLRKHDLHVSARCQLCHYRTTAVPAAGA